jgi:DNA-binding CsgD family transcriptional regulator
MDAELEQEIYRLRALNLAPKQIARKLSLRPAEVSDIIRRQAQASGLKHNAQ